MKILCISDTHVDHGAGKLPPAVYEAAKDVDLIIHAGDHVCMDVAQEMGGYAPVEAVHGNMDGLSVANSFPAKKIIEACGKRIGVAHGAGKVEDIRERVIKIFKDDNVDVIVFGHSHHAIVERHGDVLLVNPGSPLDKRYAPYNSYAVINTDGGDISAVIFKIQGLGTRD